MANMERHLGIDIGGTNIACGIVNENCEIVARSKVKTNSPRPYAEILADIIRAAELACAEAGITPRSLLPSVSAAREPATRRPAWWNTRITSDS